MRPKAEHRDFRKQYTRKGKQPATPRNPYIHRRVLGRKALWIEENSLAWDFDFRNREGSLVRQIQLAQQNDETITFEREMKFLGWLKELSRPDLQALYDFVIGPHSFYSKPVAMATSIAAHQLWCYFIIINSFNYKNQVMAKALRAWCLYILQRKRDPHSGATLELLLSNPLAWNARVIARLNPGDKYALLLANGKMLDRRQFFSLAPRTQTAMCVEVMFKTTHSSLKKLILNTLVRERPDMTYHEFLYKHGIYFNKKPTLEEFLGARRKIYGELDVSQAYYWCDDICGQARKETLDLPGRHHRHSFDFEDWRLLVKRVSRAYSSGEEELSGLKWLPKRTWDAKANKSAREAYETRLSIARDRRKDGLSQLRKVQEVWLHVLGDGEDSLVDG